MKKYFLAGLIIAIAPNICFGAGARYTQLVREKQRKMEELEKCMGSTKGLKIAGLSTIGLTAVGVAGNVVEAKKIKEYESDIEKTTKNIANVKSDITKKDEEINKKKISASQNNGNNNVNSSNTTATLSSANSSSGSSNGANANNKNLEKEISVDAATQTSMLNILHNASFEVEEYAEEVEPTPEMITYQEQKVCSGSGGSWDSSTNKCRCQNGYTVGADGRCVILFGANNSTQKFASSSTHTTEKTEPEVLSQPMSVSGREIEVADSNSNNYYAWNLTGISGDDEDEEDNDPRMLKNIITKDIEKIKNTNARLGAKIYVSGYSVLRVPGALGAELRDAGLEFKTSCSDDLGTGEEYMSLPGDYAATEYGDDLDLDMIMTNTTQYLLSECGCYTDGGYIERDGKCVKQ